jgi:hypothetical protein
MRKECGCVAVEGKHLKVLMGLGARRVKDDGGEVRRGSTIEDLALVLDLEEGTVLEAMDELLDCGVAEDRELTAFFLTSKGEELFFAISEAVKEINK